MNPTAERKRELIAIAEDHLGDRQHFDYHEWDALIECDGVLSEEELNWLRKSAGVSVTVEVDQ